MDENEIIACRDPENCRTVTLGECRHITLTEFEQAPEISTLEKRVEHTIRLELHRGITRSIYYLESRHKHLPWNPVYLVVELPCDMDTVLLIDHSVRYIHTVDGSPPYQVPSFAKPADRPGVV